MSAEETIHFCEKLFAPYLDGNALISNATHMKSPWLNFWHIVNKHWIHNNVLLLGDAAHTAHFSIGSGTKLALEDAIALNQALLNCDDLKSALQSYQAVREVELPGTLDGSTEGSYDLSR